MCAYVHMQAFIYTTYNFRNNYFDSVADGVHVQVLFACMICMLVCMNLCIYMHV
jgi:hypothetical protein